jgi:hypothetical protein
MNDLEQHLSNVLARVSEQVDPAILRLRNPAQFPRQKHPRLGTAAAAAIGIAVAAAVAIAFAAPRLNERQHAASAPTSAPGPAPTADPVSAFASANTSSLVAAAPPSSASLSASTTMSTSASLSAAGPSSRGRASAAPEVEAALRTYVACMRSHGFPGETHPNYPPRAVMAAEDGSVPSPGLADRWRSASQTCAQPYWKAVDENLYSSQ